MTDIHIQRARQILKKHPEVKLLQGPEIMSKYITTALVTVQFGCAVYASHLEWYTYALLVYSIGATITQALFLATHELSHNLFFYKDWKNRVFSIFANLPIPIPFAIAFKSYHLDHHRKLGCRGIDTDIPTELEAIYFKGTCLKFFWLACQIVAYSVRPPCIKTLKITSWLIANVVCQLSFNALIIYLYGWAPVVYFLISVIIAGGLHPCSGHFISEHYMVETATEQSTFSYYGFLNYLTWNVGYHNEHHDFPKIPWSRLPKLNCIAHDFYDSLEKYDSWIQLLIDFVSIDKITLKSRRISLS